MREERGRMEMKVRRKILIAEDDSDIVEVLKIYLENEGYEVTYAGDGQSAYEQICRQRPDLAIIDIMMPVMDGYELTRKIRETMNFPILILSAKGQDSDKILGLNLGADDYLSKPFNPLEVVARVNAGIRRSCQLNDGAIQEEQEVIEIGDLSLNVKTMILSKSGKNIPLTGMEYKILRLFMSSPGTVFTRAQIYEQVTGEVFAGDDNTVMVHISNLRDKIEDDSRTPKYLKTIRGLGYKFEKL